MKLLEQQVLVLARHGRDANLASDLLTKAGLLTELVEDLQNLSLRLGEGAGAILMTEESLYPAGIENLLDVIRAQPPWSDIPVVLLTTTGQKESARAALLMKEFGEYGNITLLERPVRIGTLLTAVQMALRARRRQYQMRDHFEERQRQDEKLREAQKLETIGVLAGGVAHDFNNLLTGILGNASLLLEDAPPFSFQREALEEIVKGGERAAILTQQLLAYAGKGKFHVRSVQLADLVKDFSKLAGNFIPKTAELRLSAQPGLPLIDADQGQLQQILMNLLINASEALEERPGGMIDVATSVCTVAEGEGRRDYYGNPIMAGEYVCLRVRDNGVGMDQATQARIFDPFFTTKFQGRGLGLAAVLGIVRGHHGYLEVESTLGSGTEFTILLPLAERERAKHSVAKLPSRQAVSGAKTVLVVDDEETVRSLARRALESRGYKVKIAENGRGALDQVREALNAIDLVVLDLTMPVMDGEETYRHLQQMQPGLKVLLSSGYSRETIAERFAGQGFAGFLQKPYSAKQLVQKVSEVLAGDFGTERD